MRTASLIAGSVLACGLAFAGRNESVVYTEGNLAGIDRNANAVLDLSSDTAIKLRVGRTDVSVPYASITKSDTAADSSYVPPPGKKAKPTQLLTVEFTSVQGEPRTMILQMSRSGASHAESAIQKHAPSLAQTAQNTSDPAPEPAKKLETRAQEPQEPPAAPAPVQTAETAPAQAAAPAPAADAQPPAAPASPDAAVAAAAPPSPDTAATAVAPADQQNPPAKPEKAVKAKKEKKNKKHQEVAANDKPADSAAKKQEWWGDSYWRTTRNNAKWDQQQKEQGNTAAAQ